MAENEDVLELPECEDDFEIEMEPQREHEVLSDERLLKWREHIQLPENLLGWRSRYKKPDRDQGCEFFLQFSQKRRKNRNRLANIWNFKNCKISKLQRSKKICNCANIRKLWTNSQFGEKINIPDRDPITKIQCDPVQAHQDILELDLPTPYEDKDAFKPFEQNLKVSKISKIEIV